MVVAQEDKEAEITEPSSLRLKRYRPQIAMADTSYNGGLFPDKCCLVSFCYSGCDSQEVTMDTDCSESKKLGGVFKFNSTEEYTPPNQTRSFACTVGNTLVQLGRTLDNMPGHQTILMKLLYCDELMLINSEPLFYRGSSEEAHNPWTKSALKTKVGNVIGKHFVLALKDEYEDIQDDGASLGDDFVLMNCSDSGTEFDASLEDRFIIVPASRNDKPTQQDTSMVGEDDTQDPKEDEHRLARVKDWINNDHAYQTNLAAVASESPVGRLNDDSLVEVFSRLSQRWHKDVAVVSKRWQQLIRQRIVSAKRLKNGLQEPLVCFRLRFSNEPKGRWAVYRTEGDQGWVTPLPQLPIHSLDFSAAASVESRIYTIGGLTNIEENVVHSLAVWILDLSTNGWQEGTHMPRQLIYPFALSAGHLIYVVGVDRGQIAAMVFDTTTNQWRNLPAPHDYDTLLVEFKEVDGRFVLWTTTSCHSFDPSVEQWNLLEEFMPLVATRHNGFWCGHLGHSINIFDEERGEWVVTADLNFKYDMNPSVDKAGGRIFVIGHITLLNEQVHIRVIEVSGDEERRGTVIRLNDVLTRGINGQLRVGYSHDLMALLTTI